VDIGSGLSGYYLTNSHTVKIEGYQIMDEDALRVTIIHELGHVVDHMSGQHAYPGSGGFSSNNWVDGYEALEPTQPDWLYYRGEYDDLPSDYVVNIHAQAPEGTYYCPHQQNCYSEDFAETFTWMVYNSRGYHLDNLDYRHDYNNPSNDRKTKVNEAISILP
jgi:hypothetical protein